MMRGEALVRFGELSMSFRLTLKRHLEDELTICDEFEKLRR